jgi:transcriptional regulator with XRE-family HTH domain
MGQTTRRGGGSRKGGQADGRELMRVKMELVAARERGERSALSLALAAHPGYVAELTEFAAAVTATSSYEHEVPTAETMAIAQRAGARALAAVFPAPATVAPSPAKGLGARAAATLKALRRARGLSLSAVARQLGLGLDVVSDLEAGVIGAATVPDRLTRVLGELLQTSAEQVRAALETQPVLRPAFGRDPSSTQEIPTRTFADAVRLSTSMSAEQKAEWLRGSAGGE